jgi:hypothetical protein
MIYTIYHAPEDTHLVVPLARFIELTEVDLICVDSEPARFATAGLVMCGSGYENQPWLKKVLRSSSSVVAVLLADVDPGVKNARTVDLRSWPGRSADRTVLALAEWLKSDGKSSFPGMSTGPAASASSPQRGQNIAAFVVLSVVVGLFFMMARFTDPKSETLTPLGASPPTAPVSSTRIPVQSSDSRPVSSSPGSTAGIAADDHRPVLADSSDQTITAVSEPTHTTVSKVPGTSRAELDQCYLLRRATGDVPTRACLISNAVRRLDSQHMEDLL